MDYKGTWESIGKTFYTTNFSLLVTALIVWDSGFFRVAPDTLNCIFELKSIENWFYVFFSISCVFGLLSYFIIDWLDANIITNIDKNVRRSDIVLWLVAPIAISTTIAILIRKGQDFGIWLYGGLIFYLFFSGLIILLRDTRIEKDAEILKWEKDQAGYNKIQRIKIWQSIIGWLYIIATISMLIAFLCNKTFFETIVLLSFNYLFIFGAFVVTIAINIILKFYRHQLILVPVYQQKLDKDKKSNTSK